MNEAPPIEDIDHRYAGVFLVTESGRVIGQQRDNIPTIDNPNKVGTFGGTIEDDENPLDAVWRELTQEETNLRIGKEAIKHLTNDVAWRELTQEWEARYFFYVEIADKELQTLEVYEGQGWAEINSPDDPMLIELWRKPARVLFDNLHPILSAQS